MTVCDVIPERQAHGTCVCDDIIVEKKTKDRIPFAGDAAIYFEENQERCGKATDEEVRACSEVPPF